MLTFFRFTCSFVLWGGRNTPNKHHWCVLTVIQPHWVCPHSQHVCFPSLHCSGSRLLCQELSDVGPGLDALPTSKPLRFRFSGTPQRCRLGWACVLCLSQVRAAQVTRCLASALSLRAMCLITSPIPAARVSRVCCLRCAMCLFCGANLWLQLSRQMSSIQDPRKA